MRSTSFLSSGKGKNPYKNATRTEPPPSPPHLITATKSYLENCLLLSSGRGGPVQQLLIHSVGRFWRKHIVSKTRAWSWTQFYWLQENDSDLLYFWPSRKNQVEQWQLIPTLFLFLCMFAKQPFPFNCMLGGRPWPSEIYFTCCGCCTCCSYQGLSFNHMCSTYALRVDANLIQDE